VGGPCEVIKETLCSVDGYFKQRRGTRRSIYKT